MSYKNQQFHKNLTRAGTSQTVTNVRLRPPYKYHGNPVEYFVFYEKFAHRLRNKKIEYLEEPAQIQTRLNAPVPDPFIRASTYYPAGNVSASAKQQAAAEAAHYNSMNLTAYNAKLKKYDDYVLQIPLDAAEAFGYMQDLLNDELKASVTTAYEKAAGNDYDKYLAAGAELWRTSGPNSETRQVWKQKLEDGIDSNVEGMSAAIATYEALLLCFTKTPDSTGVAAHATEQEKRTWLKAILRKSRNPAYDTLSTSIATTIPDPDSDVILDRIKKMVQEEKNHPEKYSSSKPQYTAGGRFNTPNSSHYAKAQDPGSEIEYFNGNPYLNLSQRYQQTSASHQSNFAAPVCSSDNATSRTPTRNHSNDAGVSSTHYGSTLGDNAYPVTCHNCKSPGHIAKNCESTFCRRCLTDFNTLQERLEHAVQAHKNDYAKVNNPANNKRKQQPNAQRGNEGMKTRRSSMSAIQQQDNQAANIAAADNFQCQFLSNSVEYYDDECEDGEYEYEEA